MWVQMCLVFVSRVGHRLCRACYDGPAVEVVSRDIVDIRAVCGWHFTRSSCLLPRNEVSGSAGLTITVKNLLKTHLFMLFNMISSVIYCMSVLCPCSNFNQALWHCMYCCIIPGGPKNVPNFAYYNCAYALWREISFCTFVDQYALLLTTKLQWRH